MVEKSIQEAYKGVFQERNQGRGDQDFSTGIVYSSHVMEASLFCGNRLVPADDIVNF